MTVSGLYLGFAGTTDLAAIILEKLLNETSHQISYVLTQADRPAGRGRKLKQSPVKTVAEKYNIEVRQPENRSQLLEYSFRDIDVLIVAAYGFIIPAEILGQPVNGCINVHTSLLPRWRGAAPIERAIINGDQETGITIIQMDEGLDTGDILKQTSCDIHNSDTAGSLHERLTLLGAKCLIQTLSDLINNRLSPVPQDDSLACYANKISKQEAKINWNESAHKIERYVRAFNPRPVSFSILNGVQMKIWETEIVMKKCSKFLPGDIIDYSPEGIVVATNDFRIKITRLQLPGKKIITCRDFYNSHPDFMKTGQTNS